jgi:hypothetical protein
MAMNKREARLPTATNNLPAIAETEEAIIRTIDHWYDLFAAVLTREAGQRVMQHKFEQVLAAAGKDPEIIAVIVALAEAGHPSAYFAIRDYAAKLLEHELELPAQVRAYLIRLLYMPAPAHPQSRGEVVDHLIRDLAIRVMVDKAVERWSLPKLNSSQHRKSAAYFVAFVLTRRGTKLTERWVRRIYQQRPQLAQRLAKFLLDNSGDQTF